MVPQRIMLQTVFILVVVAILTESSLGVVETRKASAERARATRPNVILMFLDDTGWGDFGANWNTNSSPSETPHLDELAQRGMRFTDFHAGASVCTPSRAALITGRLGLRTGITHNSGYKWLGGLPRSEPTIAEIVKSVGYDTKMIGKW